MSYGYYPKYVSVAEKMAKAEKKIKQLRKKNPDIRPVILEGQALARTWWGKAWNKNLERYADYSNRIGRGRSYVRHLAVVDLHIAPGKVTALVQGSRSRPYEVVINIAEMSKTNRQKIKEQCQDKLSSLPDLLAGKFPKALQDVFMAQGQGLFPTPQEISLACNCPDWATMCKHVAATLYGIGARLDEEPSLFFTLRRVAIDDLVGQAVQAKTDSILAGSKKKGSRVISDDNLGELFGIVMDDDFPAAGKPKVAGRNVTGKKAVKSAQDAPKSAGKIHSTAIGLVAHIINSSKKSFSIKELQETTGFPAPKLYPILARLKKQGKVKNPDHGKYCRV